MKLLVVYLIEGGFLTLVILKDRTDPDYIVARFLSLDVAIFNYRVVLSDETEHEREFTKDSKPIHIDC